MRKEKQLLLDEIESQISKKDSFIIMRYVGLKANKANSFRTEIAKMGGNIEVVRKRILIKAAKTAGIDLDVEALPGHIGLVFAGQDPLETTKAVFKFGNENEKAVQVIGGRLDGLLYTAADMDKISKLPSKAEMRAQFLSVLEAPLAHTLGVMDAVLASVVYCLDNKTKQESSENQP